MGSAYPGLPGPDELRAFRENIRGKMGWFWYATANQAIAIGGPPASPQLQIDARSDFLALEIMAVSDQDAVAVPVNFYTIEIAGSSSGRNYQSAPLENRLVAGTGQRPHYLAIPIMFQASSSIALTLTALNPLVAYNIRVAVGGVKFYTE